MAGYIFTPISDVLTATNDGNYGNKLIFKEISGDYNNSPIGQSAPKPISFDSVVKTGDYVYSLTRRGATDQSSDESGSYPLNDLNGVTITNKRKFTTDEGNLIEVTLSHNLQAPVYSSQRQSSEDFFFFDRDFNTINEAKIGFNVKPAQLVKTDVNLYDYKSSQLLQDSALNPLYTVEKRFFRESQKAINATSVVVNNTSDNVVKVFEKFPVTTQVSNSLLGIPRAEEQLSLFSDVSTLGLDESTWEYYPYTKPRVRYEPWERRNSNSGNRYSASMIENIDEQAIELSANPVPYSFPWNESDQAFYQETQFKKYKNFIILGNMLWLHFEGTGLESQFLNPNEVRWSIQGGNLNFGSQAENYFELHGFGEGINEETAFRIIDRWTETWVAVKRGEGITTENFIDNTILNPNSIIGYELQTIIKNKYSELNILQHGDSNKTATISIVLEQHFRQELPLVYSEANTNGTQPGYAHQVDIQNVVLQSKEVYRYQPGRISGFTFGTRVDIDDRSEENYAEWGCVNESDEYVLKLAGSNLSIVRRSTIPLTDQSLSLSGGFSSDSRYYKTFKDTKPLIGGDARPEFYELTIPQDKWNGDPLNGNGPSGYTIDPEQVTMWKIEFSWYGAIGVQFYAYVPIGLGEARWVKLHRIIIENSLPQANLQDPYFRMRYNLVVGAKEQTTKPQFIYKYGSSVYIDGGDEGTKTVQSYQSDEKSVPEDFDLPIAVDDTDGYKSDDNFVPVLGLKNKRFIANREGFLRPSRILSIPTDITVSSNKLVEIDFLEAEAGPDGFAFTYDNGLRWNPNASPGIAQRNLQPGVNKPAGIEFLNDGGSHLSPFASNIVDFVFTDDGSTDKNVYKLSITKQQNVSISSTETDSTGRGIITRDHTSEFPRKYQKIVSSTDSPLMLDESFDDAKVFAPGLNSLYIDWQSTIEDATITKVTSAVPGSSLFGKQLVAEFRVKEKKPVITENGTEVDWSTERKISTSDPLFQNTTSGSYFKTGADNIQFNWINYKSLAAPKIPENRYISENAFTDGTRNNYSSASPSRSLQGEFLRNFGYSYTLGNSPFAGKTYEITDKRQFAHPFRKFANGIDIKYYAKRSAFREYPDVESGFCVPYSYGFGQVKLQKANDAVAASSIGLSGKEITCRFLNPHAANVPLIKDRFTGKRLAQGKYPQFQIGFTNRKPSATTAGNNNQWNGKFESPAGADGFLNDKDYIAVEYRPSHNNNDASVGQSANAERNFQQAEILQNDYRIKPIPNEGQSVTSQDSNEPGLGYHIGGMASSVTLNVDPNFTEFSGLDYEATFSSFKTTYKGVAAGGATYAKLDGTIAGVTERILFDDFPELVGESTLAISDLNALGFGENQGAGDSTKFFLILRDLDGTFAKALENDLDIFGGEVVISTLSGAETTTHSTGFRITSKPARFEYYADASNSITAASYPGQTQSAYLIQVAGDVEAATGATLDDTSKILFKIVKLKYPDGLTGIDQVEVQKVFSGGVSTWYPVIKLREDAQINNINYKVSKPNQAPGVISPLWKVYGATQIIKPITENSPQGGDGSFLDNRDNQEGGVVASIPESFGSVSRLSGLEVNGNMNKILRKSVGNPGFVALRGDPAAVQTLTSGITVYDRRGKLAEKSRKVTSYYFGPNENSEGTKSSTIPLYNTFGEDRNKLLPDQLGVKALFVRAQKVNLSDTATNATVKIGINVSEL